MGRSIVRVTIEMCKRLSIRSSTSGRSGSELFGATTSSVLELLEFEETRGVGRFS